MALRFFFTVFFTVFLAELGDKTQLATLLFSANADVPRWVVFWAATLALTATSALGVLGGGVLARFVSERQLNFSAGLGFLLMGAWTLYKAWAAH
jgi:putative Ca2+/H+ antiporter (TMEM165/GDT1 family)